MLVPTGACKRGSHPFFFGTQVTPREEEKHDKLALGSIEPDRLIFF